MTFAARTTVHLLLLVALVAAVFGITLANGFVWDDTLYFIGNPVYRDFNLRAMFFGLGNGLEYLPLRDLSYGLDYLLWGERAFGFHLTNLVLYVLNVLVVYQLTRELLILVGPAPGDAAQTDRTPLLTALLFAVHPLHSEPVAWVTGRNVLLSGLCFFLAVLLFARFLGGTSRQPRASYLGALLLFAAALLSKATTLILPGVLLLLAAYGPAERRRRGLLAVIPFLVLAGGFFLLFRAIGLQAGVIGEQAPLDNLGGFLAAKVAVAAQIPFFYLAKLLVPINLLAEYIPAFSAQLLSLAALGALAGLALVGFLLFALRRRLPACSLGLAWFLMTLLPVLNFFYTVPIVADRYVYLPSFGFCLAVAVAPALAGRGVPRWLPLAVVLLLVSFWGPAAFLRNQVWRSEQLLWEDTLRKEPRRVKAYLRLGLLALDAGDTERGFAYLAKLRNLDARFDYYGFYRARQARVSGDRAGAIALFETVLRRNDDYIEALFEMGELMEETGQYEQAIDYYTRAIDSRQQGEGWALKKDARQRLEALRSRFAPQLAALRRAVAERPDDAAARAELALKLDWLGDYREALDLYQGLERGGVKNWGLFFNMGNIYRKLGRDRDAATHFEQAVQADPGQAQAWNNLGNVRLDLGEREGAITAFQRAIALDSGFAFAQLNLGRAYLDAGRIPEAMEQLTRVRARFPELAPRADAYLQTARQKSGKRG